MMELMVVVIVVSLLAALAVPAMIRARDDRHTYDNAMHVAQLIRGARLRAIGRGTAVAVHLQANNAAERGKYLVYEAVTWNTQGAIGSPTEWRSPIASCLAPNWAAAPATGNALLLDGASFNGNLDAQIDFQSTMALNTTGAAAASTDLWLCFTPAGRAFAVNGATPTFTAAGSFLDVTVCMRRGGCASGKGISRTLVVPPTGVARIVSK